MVATNSIHVRLTFYGVLVDVRGDDVAQWKVFWLDGPYQPPDSTRVTTIEWLRKRTFRAAPTDFLASLLVLTEMPGRDFAWFPFQCVNPRNLTSYTHPAEPGAIDGDGLQQRFDALVLPQSFRLGPESEPFQPQDGFVLHDALARLSQKRASVQAALPAEPEPDLESEAGELADIVGRMPPGHDAVDYTPDDLKYRDGGGRVSVDEVTWSEPSLRRFLCCLRASFAAQDFRLPELIEVMSLRGSTRCCASSARTRTTWASSTALRGVLPLLEMFKSASFRRSREASCRQIQASYSQALELARGYRRVIDDFVDGRDRAHSPLAWTAADDEEHAGGPISAVESEARKLAHRVEEAQAILKDRATEDVYEAVDATRFADIDVRQLDQRIDARYRELLKTDPDYLELQRKRSAGRSGLGRGGRAKAKEGWAR